MLAVGLCALPAYLLGTFPTAHLIVRAHGRDVTAEGSGNPGASNVARLLGARWGVLAFLGDAAKGAVPAGAGLVLEGRAGGYLLGVAAVIGHVFPVTRRFKGGRGVATAAGMMLVLHPLIAVGLMLMWLVVGKVLKLASVASLVCASALPVLAWAVDDRDGWEIAVLSAISLLIVARHAKNLRRLVRGSELRLGDPRQS
jgi:acyl phosphate:glycerol-3-phosphate acyltransferase